MADEVLQYSIKSTAQLNAMEQAMTTFDKLARDYVDTADSIEKVSKEAKEAETRINRLTQAGKGLGNAMGTIKGPVLGALGGVAGLVGGAMLATQNWSLEVEKLSSQFAIGLEEASALALSWEKAGLSAEQGASIMSGFQGRLIGELEAQKEAAGRLGEIQAQRAEVFADMAQAETDHHATIADLEAQRAEINGSNIKERRDRQAEALNELVKNYQRFTDRQEEAEREQTKAFETAWEDRVRKFEQSNIKLQDDMTEKARSARNVREFLAARDEFDKKSKLLKGELTKDQSQMTSAHEKQVKSREQANNREKALLEERSAEINEAASRDVAKMEEANQKALVDLNKRIEAEKMAYQDRSDNFNEKLADIRQAEQEAAQAGGDLTFIMEELGVKIFDADGKMRPFNDIIWDVKEAIDNMEDSGRKAALIADLGLEDAAVWIERGAGAHDALRDAQSKNLVVTEEQLDAIHRQRAALKDLELAAIGYATQMNLTQKVNEGVAQSLTWVQEASIIAAGLWDQLQTIANLLWAKIVERFEILKDVWAQVLEIMESLVDWIENKVMSAVESIPFIGGGEDGDGGFLSGLLPGFAVGTRSVPGIGPQLTVVHPGEEIRTRAQVLQDNTSGRGGGRGGLTVNIGGNVYGVEDLQGTIMGALERYDMGVS